ncbi:hypothetical protein CH063_10029 [Colletotrichum higginsianum]|uniref:Uncharacterized protein n=1 Tax=Colletotrichum higginsianum (strain IMI 349063) TaxID=759273 RepID=H1VFV8_COLHI|nr:hypothetical protein CH063_10029 [Colletotrichum higginsianum]
MAFDMADGGSTLSGARRGPGVSLGLSHTLCLLVSVLCESRSFGGRSPGERIWNPECFWR